jgi:hypothetical protein
MKIQLNRTRTSEIISFLFMILFMYAATSKLLEYSDFVTQISSSPLIATYANILAWAVPTIEFITALILFIPSLRMLGLYLSFTIMLSFTLYIFIILNFSPKVPCSCGGILSSMEWKEHFIFNIAFTILAILGLHFEKNAKQTHINII